jgi:hypothetical protein
MIFIVAILSGLTLAANNYGSDVNPNQSATPYMNEVAADKLRRERARANGNTARVDQLTGEIRAGNAVVAVNQERGRDRAAYNAAVAKGDTASAAKYQQELRTDNRDKNKAVDNYQKKTEGASYNQKETNRDRKARDNAKKNGNYVAANRYQNQINSGKKNGAV